MKRVKRCTCFLIVTITLSGPAMGGPNLVSVGYFDLPPAQATVRYSMTDYNTLILEFTGEHHFGRILVRTTTPRSVARENVRAFYTGARGGAPGAMVFAYGTTSLENPQVIIEFDLKGQLRPGRTYEYECEIGGETEIQGGIPAIIPAFWADGQAYGTEVQLTQPLYFTTAEKLSRNKFIRGTVQLPAFEQMTGTAKIVLKLPNNFGNYFAVSRMTFREIDEELKAGLDPEMPSPLRYIPIKTEAEGQIAEALRKGKELFLELQKQNPDGYWPAGDLAMSVGLTSTIVSFLGELGDPSIQDSLTKAMNWLAAQEPPQGETFSVQTVAARLYTLARHGGVEKYRKTITRDMDYLARAQYDSGGWSQVSWAVQSREASVTAPDHLVTMVVMIALREAALVGVDCPRKVWNDAATYWTKAQSSKSGGFRQKLEQYGGLSENVTDARTAVGLIGLMTSLEMSSGPGTRNCRQFLGRREVLKGIDSALAFMNRRYGLEFFGAFAGEIGQVSTVDPFTRLSIFQHCRAISGIKEFNNIDYFVREAEVIFNPQYGIYDYGSGLIAGSLLATANCLEAFAIGSSPTVIQRVLIGGPGGADYEHCWDVQHAVRYLMSQRKRPLNWRRAHIDQTAREWLEVPMMFLNVAGPVELTSAQRTRLRDYAFNGGSILINIVQEHESQRDAMLSQLRQIFPEYELRDLPADHPVLSLREKIDTPPAVKVLGNGIRDFVFVAGNDAQGDWSCAFHAYRIGRNDSWSKFAFVNNLLDYTMDGSPLRSSFDESTMPAPAAPTRDLRVAHLEFGGPRPVYPDLLKTLDVHMTSNYRTRIVDAGPAPAPLLWVSITGPAGPTAQQKQRIADHVASGGYLLVDVVSGNTQWGESGLSAIRSILADVSIVPIRTLHPIYTGKIPGTQGFDARGGTLRKALQTDLIKNGRNDFTLLLRQGREIGAFSAFDLASGLTGAHFPGCRGLEPPSARPLVLNAVLYAMYLDKQK